MSSVDTKKLDKLRLQSLAAKQKSLVRVESESKLHLQSGKPAPRGLYHRDSLPAVMVDRNAISIWSLLKNSIGKDLAKITFPVVLNEPITMIQRLSEYMEYSFLLDRAAKADNPIDRLEYVCGFVTSALSVNWMRPGKPFNAVHGETFELLRPDLGFKFVGEQVSHHPPVTAFHVEGSSGWEFHGAIAPGLSFWGKSVDVTPKGFLHATLNKYSETYIWQNVNCYIHNILYGELWIELVGTINVTCNKNQLQGKLHFKQAGWYSKDLHFVEGQIFDGNKLEKIIYGSWVKGMYSCKPEAYQNFNKDSKLKTKMLNDMKKVANEFLNENAGNPVLTYNFEIPNQRTLWQSAPKLLHSKDYYNFSLFTMTLNQLPGIDNHQNLPPTDSRFRPDQRMFENGNIKAADEMKLKIEAKQRQRKQGEIKPMWFKFARLPSTGREEWIFDKSYWARNWSKCPDLFSI